MKKPFAVYFLSFVPRYDRINGFEAWVDNLVRTVRVRYFKSETDALDFFHKLPSAFRVVDRYEKDYEGCIDCRTIFLMDILIPVFQQINEDYSKKKDES